MYGFDESSDRTLRGISSRSSALAKVPPLIVSLTLNDERTLPTLTSAPTFSRRYLTARKAPRSDGMLSKPHEWTMIAR